MSFRRLLVILAVLGLLCTLLSGCRSDPKATVKGFYDALRKGEYTKLASYVEDVKQSDLQDLDDPNSAEILAGMFSRLNYTIAPDATIQGTEATVGVSVTAPDLAAIFAETTMEALQIMFAAAFAGEDALAEAEAEVQKLFEDALTDPEAPKRTTDMQLKLKKVGGKWVIAKGENPFGFITDALNELTDPFPF